LQHRQKAIHRIGKAAFRRVAIFIFAPQGDEFGFLRFGQKPENALSREFFFFDLGRSGRVIVKKSVVGIDFNDVVQKQHFDDAIHIDFRFGIFSQQHRHQRDMPAVFGRILATGEILGSGATQNGFELVEFEQKIELGNQAFRHDGFLRMEPGKIVPAFAR